MGKARVSSPEVGISRSRIFERQRRRGPSQKAWAAAMHPWVGSMLRMTCDSFGKTQYFTIASAGPTPATPTVAMKSLRASRVSSAFVNISDVFLMT
ncbi:hypothetical protein J8273_4072 [Carpediemonas membranifera]|uniref:Uncharacterized protein n=1 Tax=Carpediemonas membranifera TaxID=201153 RepID=A0A8J6BYF1_9EUKA|nr:hypothetical protein J8273_4072 [Carpediemonas membranifera]|eukprot:KAG9394416.1 hypothetical protein J8273_4072 [Carpediemonas membranifera]